MQRQILSTKFLVDSPLPGSVMMNNYSLYWERRSPNLDRILFFLKGLMLLKNNFKSRVNINVPQDQPKVNNPFGISHFIFTEPYSTSANWEK